MKRKDELPSISEAHSIKPLALVVCEEIAFTSDNEIAPVFENNGAPRADYAFKLSCALERYFRVAPPIRCGSELWQALFNEIPKVVIMSQTLRDIDAVSLIRTLRSSKYGFNIRFFICCNSVNNSVKSVCTFNRIDGAYSFSDSIEETAESIFKVYSELAENEEGYGMKRLRDLIDDSYYFSDPENEKNISSDITSKLLVPLGLDRKHKGTQYLNLLICMCVCGAQADLKEMYDCVAEYFNTSGSAVEKAIRYAIEQAWRRSSPYIQYYLFGNTVDADKGKPTNAEFISTTVRHTVERISKGVDLDF